MCKFHFEGKEYAFRRNFRHYSTHSKIKKHGRVRYRNDGKKEEKVFSKPYTARDLRQRTARQQCERRVEMVKA